jgi:hypothetical protein
MPCIGRGSIKSMKAALRKGVARREGVILRGQAPLGVKHATPGLDLNVWSKSRRARRRRFSPFSSGRAEHVFTSMFSGGRQ